MDDVLSLLPFRAEVSTKDLCAWSCISKRLKIACYSPSLWRSVQINAPEFCGNVYGWGLEMLSGRCSNMEKLVIRDIKILDRPSPWMHYGLEKLLEASGEKLKILKLNFICELPFTDLLLNLIGKHCSNLNEIELSASNYFATDSAVSSFLRHCKKIKSFSCFVFSPQPIHALGDSVLWQIGSRLPFIEKLEINANHVTENGILGIQTCTQLKSLSLYGHSRGLFDRAFNAKKQEGELLSFPNLKEIRFAFVLPSSGELRRLMTMCPSLSLLDLLPSQNDERMIHHASVLITVANTFSPALTVNVKLVSLCNVLLLPAPKLSLLKTEMDDAGAEFLSEDSGEFCFGVTNT